MPTDQGISHKPAGHRGRPADTAPLRETFLSAAIKRCLDLIFGLITLAVALPILLLASLTIKLESPGTVLYRQWRSGRGGKPFQILKLRTMVDGADRLGPALTQSADPRIPRFGSVLRRWSVDELPQLLNVLAGQMSLVGPRPELVTIAARYTPRQQGVLRALPGMTGWSQIKGRDDLSIAEKLELDLNYAMNRTTRWDLMILTRTVRVVLGGRGVKR
jgi:lipopolysaccharide/colanic/teichoic acid biosynthesis glycosyltransferase